MATFLDTTETPLYGELWFDEMGQAFYLLERSFPRGNRMVCLMESVATGYCEYFVFPY